MKFLSKFYIGIIFFLLYIPIAVMIVFSFNEAGTLAEFTGITPDWYIELFHDEEALSSLINSLILAISSSVIATVIGTFGALGLHRMKNRYIKASVNSMTNVPMMNPDIVTGVSMMLLFVAVAGLLKADKLFGFWTMLIAHVTFSLPYVILSVLPKIKQMDKHLPEAAMDLGCTPIMSFFKVELPCILPGVISGMLMAFTLSLDDFVISYFVKGTGFETLPIYIYSAVKKGVRPTLYAANTVIIVIVLVLLVLINFVGNDDKKKKIKSQKEIKS